MASIMTVAMVPATAFAATNITQVDEVHVAEDANFISAVELSIDNNGYAPADDFYVDVTLENGKFNWDDNNNMFDVNETDEDEDLYHGVNDVQKISDTKARIKLDAEYFINDIVTVEIAAKAIAAGDVVATFKSNERTFTTVKDRCLLPCVTIFFNTK